MKLYLVRHGESEANRDGIIQGHYDSNLSELGVAQAKKIGKRLQNYNFDLVYSSDLKRAIKTANEILKYHDNELNLDKQLREIHRGDWTGKKRSEIPIEKIDFSDFENHRFPNGESPKEHRERVKKFFENNKEEFKDKSILIVSHGGTTKKILSYMLDLDIEKTHNKFRTKNTCLYEIDCSKEKPKIILNGCIKHLD